MSFWDRVGSWVDTNLYQNGLADAGLSLRAGFGKILSSMTLLSDSTANQWINESNQHGGWGQQFLGTGSNPMLGLHDKGNQNDASMFNLGSSMGSALGSGAGTVGAAWAASSVGNAVDTGFQDALRGGTTALDMLSWGGGHGPGKPGNASFNDQIAHFFSGDQWAAAWDRTAPTAQNPEQAGDVFISRGVEKSDPQYDVATAQGRQNLAKLNQDSAGVKFSTGVFNLAEGFAADPTRGLGKLAEVARAGAALDVSKATGLIGSQGEANLANKMFEASRTPEGEAAPIGSVTSSRIANTAKAAVGKVGSISPDAYLQNLDKFVQMTEKDGKALDAAGLQPVFNAVDKHWGNETSAIAHTLFAQAGQIADDSVRLATKRNILLTGMGSDLARDQLIADSPEIAKSMQRALSPTMENADVLRSMVDKDFLNPDFHLSDYADMLASNPGNAEELGKLASMVDPFMEGVRKLDNVAVTGSEATGLQRIEQVGLTRLQATYARAQQEIGSRYTFQFGPSSRTMHVISWAANGATGRVAPGAIDVSDPVVGSEQLANTLKRSGVMDGQRIRNIVNNFVAADPTQKQQVVSDSMLEMSRAIGAKYGFSAKDADAIAKTAMAHLGNGRRYANRLLQDASANNLNRITIDDFGGSAIQVDRPLLQSHLANSAGALDPRLMHQLYRWHMDTDARMIGTAAAAAAKAHRAADLLGQGLDHYTNIWRLGVLGRPGLGVRALLDTQLRSVATVGAAASLTNAFKGLWHSGWVDKYADAPATLEEIKMAQQLRAEAAHWRGRAAQVRGYLPDTGSPFFKSEGAQMLQHLDENPYPIKNPKAFRTLESRDTADTKAAGYAAKAGELQDALDKAPWHETTMSVRDLKQIQMDHRIDPESQKIADLSDDIAQKGVRKPLQVEETNKGTVLTDGHHRLIAAEKAGLDQLPVRVFKNSPEGRAAANRAMAGRKLGQGPSKMADRLDRALARHEMWMDREAEARTKVDSITEQYGKDVTQEANLPKNRAKYDLMNERADRLEAIASTLEKGTGKQYKHILGQAKAYKVGGDTVYMGAYKSARDADNMQVMMGQEMDPSSYFQAQTTKYSNKLRTDLNNWHDVKPDDRNWADAYVKSTDALRNSPTARKIMQMSDIPDGKDILRILRSDPAAKAEYAKVGKLDNISSFDQWASGVMDYVRYYAPSPEARQALLNGGRMERADVEKLFPTEADRFQIHGPHMDHLRPSTLGEWVKGKENTFFQNVLDKPDMMMVKHPTYVSLYEQHVQKLLADYGKTLGEGESANIDALQAIDRTARNRAVNGVKRIMYDTRHYTRLDQSMRFIAPFIRPWEDAMRTWSKIVYNDPSVFGKMLVTWNAPEMMNWVVDQNGKKVNPFDTSPNKQEFIVLPVKVPGLSDFRIRKDAFNSITQGSVPWLPGFGPVVQVPAQVIMPRIYPEFSNPNNPIYQSLFPGGEVPKGNFSDLVASQMPSTVRALWQAGMIGPGGKDTTQYGMLYQADINQQIINARDKGLPVPSPQQLDAHATAAARNAGIIKAIATGLFGLSGQASPEAQHYIEMMQTLRAAEPILLKTAHISATQAFNSMFPEAADLNWSISVNDTGINATEQAQVAAKKYAGLVNKYPQYGGVIIGDDNVGGQFSRGAYDAQMTNGVGPNDAYGRHTKSPDQILQDAQVREGWFDYNKVNAMIDTALAQRGLANLQQSGAEDLQLIKAKSVAMLRAQNPQWSQAYDQAGSNVPTFAAVARQIVNEPQIAKRPDIVAMRQYLDMRDEANQAIKYAGMSMSGQSLKDFRTQVEMQLYAYGYQLAQSQIGFDTNAWQPYFEREFKFNADQKAALAAQGLG